jgi:hypothetical protein
MATPDQLVWKPTPERWSICEILNHLTDVEKLNAGLRVQRMLNESLPSFEDYDQAARYKQGAYANDDGLRGLESFCETRLSSLQWLEGITPEAWERRGRHPDVGEITIRQVLSLWSFHDLSHIRQISEILKAQCFWDDIGSLQKYYRVDP